MGLAAAAHLIRYGMTLVIFEAGAGVGTAPLSWEHVRMFSSWQYNIDRAARELLERHGWLPPDSGVNPTGREIVEQYLRPLAATPEIAGCLHL